MDNELAGSKVMEGFIRKPVEAEKEMNAEDKEDSSEKEESSQSSVRIEENIGKPGFDHNGIWVGEGPLDIDLNVVNGLLKSYASQVGYTGPTETILSSFGFELPDNADTANKE